MHKNIFYKPEDAWPGDFIPFYKDGEFRLFYLKDWRNIEKNGEGTPWCQVSTRDFISFTDHGEMIARGTREEQDLFVFTGCVIEARGLYHIFYTGNNPYLREKDKPQQAVMHAVSKDLLHWEKRLGDTFFAPTEKYERDDWRDPFVFWNEEAGEYWMLLAARLKTGPSRRRGCTALCVSKDLKKWEARDPFWAPGLYYTHECPDLFKIGEWWYLVYSTFSERCVTHYRMSKSLSGPWVAPDNDTFDGRAFYAAKTWSDGTKRYAFGWNPTRDSGKDYAYWQWGGNLVVHEVIQEKDGTLIVKVPDSIDKAFNREQHVEFINGFGNWNKQGNRIKIDAPESFACAAAEKMPQQCKINMKLSFSENTRGCGIMLRVDDDLEKAYYIRLEPQKNRMVFDSWPRPNWDIPFMLEMERPIFLIAGKEYELKVFVEDTVCEVYVDDKIAMSTRMYDNKEGTWGVFVNEGSAVFSDMKIRTINMK